MIQQQTLLKVSDNSGARTVKCIKVLGGFKRKYAYAGNVIIVSIQRLRNRARHLSKVKKGEIHKALIIRTKTKIKRKDGNSLRFNDNAVVLINKQQGPIASRIIGPISKFVRKEKFARIVTMASKVA